MINLLKGTIVHGLHEQGYGCVGEQAYMYVKTVNLNCFPGKSLAVADKTCKKN